MELQKEIQGQLQQTNLDSSFLERLKTLKTGEADNILKATIRNDVNSSRKLLAEISDLCLACESQNTFLVVRLRDIGN